MFNVRPPFPWLFISRENERGLSGFNVEPSLLDGFIQAATREPQARVVPDDEHSGQPIDLPGVAAPSPLSALTGLESFLPEPFPGQAPAPSDDWPEPGSPVEYEVEVRPGPGRTIVDQMPVPPAPDRPTDGEPDPAFEPEFEFEPGTTTSTVPTPPVPTPAPSSPLPWRDWVSVALDRMASIHGIPRQEQRAAAQPRPRPGPRPWTWTTADTESDSGTTSGERLLRTGDLDPRYLVPAGGPPGTGKPPGGPREAAPGSKQTEASRPPGNHNGPPGPPPNDLSEVEPSRAPPATQRQYKWPKFRMPGWRGLLAELLRRMPIKQAIDALWESERRWEFDQHIASITPTVRIAGSEPPDVSGPFAGGRRRLDVPLSDYLPEPQTSEDYSPKTENQRKGAVGEFHLANRAVERIPGETVVYYGIPGGVTGADIISVSRNGTISVWDSKWRGSVRSVTELMRGYQTKDSVDALAEQVRRMVSDAARRGDLDGVDVMRALKNATEGNFFINTIGTGEAHSGVVQQVVNGKPGAIRRIPR